MNYVCLLCKIAYNWLQLNAVGDYEKEFINLK